MVRTESIHTSPHRTDQDAVGGSSRDRAVSSDGFRIAVYPAIVLVCLAATHSAAGSGPGLAIKVGAQTMEDPVDLSTTTRTRLGLEIASQRFGGDHFDLALGFGGSYLGPFSEEDAYFDGDVFVEDYFTSELALFDVRLAARLYLCSSDAAVQPYLGAGIGYFWFLGFWEDVYSETVPDPVLPDVFYTFTDVTSGTDTLAHGFFPFVTAGVTVPVGPHCDLMFEFQYDFAKSNSGFDLSGPIYMFGCRIRW
ncbi:MAG: hypothetical protein JSU70_08445 [Phycisphaerales bacterium]|nr:MAG: hypothetical protein JSU70_08445 [Phycisphaerales bacterium]